MKRGSRAARVQWGVADQIASSIGSFALGVLVARTASRADFGAFGVTFATYTLAIGLVRAMSSEPFVVRFSAEGKRDQHAALAGSAGATLVVAIGLSALIFALSQLASSGLSGLLKLLAVTFPLLALQDLWRFGFVASGRGAHAFANDAIWTVLMLIFVASDRLFIPVTTANAVFGAWCASGCIAGIIGTIQTGTVPQLRRSVAWLKHNQDLAARYSGEFGATALGSLVALYAVGALAGLRAAGTIRGGQTLLAPVSVLFTGLVMATIPEASRILASDRDRLLRLIRRASPLLMVVPPIWCAVLLLVPDGIGKGVLGPSWQTSRHVIIPLGLSITGTAASLGPMVGLRALAAASYSLRARLLTSPPTLVAVGVGSFWWGATGAAWSLAVTGLFTALTWWLLFEKAADEFVPGLSVAKTIGVPA